MKKKYFNNKGFTFLELVIALALLGIIIIPISSLFIGSAKSTNTTNDKMVASYIAQREMEKIKSSNNISETETIEKIKDDQYKSFSYEIEISKLDNYLTPENQSFDIDNTLIVNSQYLNDQGYYSLIVNKGGSYSLTKDFNGVFQTKDDDITLLLDVETNSNNILKVSNNTNKVLKIYLKKGQDIDIENIVGDIRVYRNYNDNSDGSQSGSRVYQVVIKVYKKDKQIEELQGYKNIIQ